MYQYRLRIWLVLMVLLALGVSANSQGVAYARTATGFLTFENGSDGSEIGTNIPGVSFSSDTGTPWLYGDVRTHRYNAPYKQDCSDRPPEIASPIRQYRVAQQHFAWVGTLGASGSIEFTLGTASFVNISFSNGSRLTVVAYDASDTAIAAASIAPNTGTGRFGVARLNAPAGQQISFIRIESTANFWMMDNLETDAPGVPDQRDKGSDDAAFITVVQHATQVLAPAPDRSVTYTIVATNRGRASAKNTIITMPFDPTRAQPLDATFSKPGAWVSRVLSDALELQTGPLGSRGDVVTATIRLAVLPGTAAGDIVSQRLAFAWSDDIGGGAGRSNQIVPATTADPLLYALSVEPVSQVPETFNLSTNIFAPGEPISLWYHTSDGRDIPIEHRAAADDDGRNRP